ncbi:MAG: N-acetylneuraminate synthase family protein [Synergistaceae bacterium]|nr:N-acetylneuraminate synthase family protein [Synergistaceae bacterium]
MKDIKINDNVTIGDKSPCFIISEIGANHNRSLSMAKELIDASVEAKADAVKFQIYSAENLYSRKTPLHSGYKKDLFSLIKEIETPRDWLPELADYCKSKDVIFFATPFDKEAADELDKFSCMFKIASFEIVDLQLVKHVASKNKPVIISTGLCNMEEIEDAVLTCGEAGNDDIVLLQCASMYPSTPDIMNLRAMETMRRAFGVQTGLSDHTQGISISLAAAAIGARVIEKHVTLNRNLEGPDHPFAIEPDELAELVKNIRDVESAMGDGIKRGPNKKELEFYAKARRSLHAAMDISEGEIITEHMLCSKRPGYGIKPKFIDLVIGRKAKRRIEAEEWITWEMV